MTHIINLKNQFQPRVVVNSWSHRGQMGDLNFSNFMGPQYYLRAHSKRKDVYDSL